MVLAVLAFLISVASAYPTMYYPYYNFDTVAVNGASAKSPSTLVMSGHYHPFMPSPYFEASGAAAFSGNRAASHSPPDRGTVRVCPQCNQNQQPYEPQLFDPQQNVIPIDEPVSVYQAGLVPTEPTHTTEQSGTTENGEATTVTATELEIIEEGIEKVTPATTPIKPVPNQTRVGKKKVAIKPVVEDVDEGEEENDDQKQFGKVPYALFPMFFGGGRSSGGPGGATAIANAYSTGNGGVATSHATAYGMRPDEVRH